MRYYACEALYNIAKVRGSYAVELLSMPLEPEGGCNCCWLGLASGAGRPGTASGSMCKTLRKRVLPLPSQASTTASRNMYRMRVGVDMRTVWLTMAMLCWLTPRWPGSPSSSSSTRCLMPCSGAAAHNVVAAALPAAYWDWVCGSSHCACLVPLSAPGCTWTRSAWGCVHPEGLGIRSSTEATNQLVCAESCRSLANQQPAQDQAQLSGNPASLRRAGCAQTLRRMC